MVGYTILEMEKLPESLKNRPRWVTCVAFVTGMLMITVTAISIGIFIGYTYCYIENRAGFRSGSWSDNQMLGRLVRLVSSNEMRRPGNITHETNFQIVQMPLTETDDGAKNRTINNAIMSSMIVSRILNIGHALMEDELSCLS